MKLSIHKIQCRDEFSQITSKLLDTVLGVKKFGRVIVSSKMSESGPKSYLSVGPT